MKKRNAFTLAEVLITLGIIGIVAAMTLPIIVEDYRKKATAEALRKSYAELNQVLTMAISDYGDMQNWDYQSAAEISQWVQKYIKPYVKYTKAGECKDNKSSKCLGVPVVGQLGGGTKLSGYMVAPYVIVKSGGASTAWAFYKYNAYSEVRVHVYLKVPYKQRGVKGRNVFTFVLYPSGKPMFVPFGIETRPKIAQVSRDALLKGPIRAGGCFKESGGPDYYGPGDGCGAVIMMDGWKISDDYPW